MAFEWKRVEAWPDVAPKEWLDWHWQLRQSWQTQADFSRHWRLSGSEEQALQEGLKLFKVRVTPYYARLVDPKDGEDPIRKIILPRAEELSAGFQQQFDPLGEAQNRPSPRIIHRYSDRALFLVTDQCSVYCRYCTRKHFTASGESMVRGREYEEALTYLRQHRGLREVILSGGDPLTLNNNVLAKICADLRKISHIEIIRIGTRMPIVCPMRIDESLVKDLKPFAPIYFMLHFNHPREITYEAAQAVSELVDNGFPCLNQMVLLNGVNNHPAIVQALSRRLVYLRVYPYYMFQCDPSMGTDHLRTSVEQSLSIQRELWGHLSGLALPQLSLDIPSGGGKMYYTPNFETNRVVRGGGEGEIRQYQGWDGVRAEYISPPITKMQTPSDAIRYADEWQLICSESLAKSDK